MKSLIYYVLHFRPFLFHFAHYVSINTFAGTAVVVIVRQLELQLHVQSVPITTKVVSSNPFQGEEITFVNNLRQVGVFFPGDPVSSTNKTDRHHVTEILLKVAINTISQI